MVAITVYHPHSPQYAERLSGGVGSCEAGNPTCCEFAIRIVDVEDPALLYAPLGPAQVTRKPTEQPPHLQNHARLNMLTRLQTILPPDSRAL